MENSFKYTFLLLINLMFLSCKGQQQDLAALSPTVQANYTQVEKQVLSGADNLGNYLPALKNKKIALVTNQTGILTNKNQHIVDYLLDKKIDVIKIFSPEHGFRGKADAGEKVTDGKDSKTGLPVVSLYGDNKKPKKSQLKGVELILFDLQDVGVRFYTYISTLHYVMEAAAENNIPVWVLDRPNPNAHYVDGPVLEEGYTSFVGMHKVPVVYGMTIGEYAKMINGEKWLKNGIQADLKVIENTNYTHDTPYKLPVKPSPNLPNATAVNLYPSLCFFEGTYISVGRGTDMQFQVYGSPYLKNMTFSFVPKPNEGAKSPIFNHKKCYGENLTNVERLDRIELKWLIKAYQNNTNEVFIKWPKKGKPFFDKLAGTSQLRKQIEKGMSEQEIRSSWQKDLMNFQKIRAKYLLYK